MLPSPWSLGVVLPAQLQAPLALSPEEGMSRRTTTGSTCVACVGTKAPLPSVVALHLRDPNAINALLAATPGWQPFSIRRHSLRWLNAARLGASDGSMHSSAIRSTVAAYMRWGRAVGTRADQVLGE